jgi:hypothetical protein
MTRSIIIFNIMTHFKMTLNIKTLSDTTTILIKTLFIMTLLITL